MILSGSFFKWTSFVGSAVCDPVGIRGSLHMKPGRFKVKKKSPAACSCRAPETLCRDVGLEAPAETEHDFVVVGADANGLAFTAVVGGDFGVAEVDIAVLGVNGNLIVHSESDTAADVPCEVCPAFILAAKIPAEIVVRVDTEVVEGEAEAGAHVRREGGFIVEVIVHVAEQRGGIESFLGGTVVAVPFLLAVAAESAFEFDTQGEHVLGPEVIADGESSAKRELIVFVDAESAHAGTLNSSGILKSHHEFGCQVHAVPGGSDIRKSEGAHKRKCNKKAFHISSRKICLCPAGF